MGKISLPAKSKKAEDVIGLIKESEDSATPTKTTLDVSHHPSPTPKHPLTKTKAGYCQRACFVSLGVTVVLVLFVSTAFLVDYQQGNLATHTSQLPKEVREFPRQVGKYVVGVIYQTPKDLQRLFDRALNWSKKNESDRPRKNNRLPKFLLQDEDLHEIVLDQSKEDIESSVPIGELSKLPEEGNDDTVVDDGLAGVAHFFVGIWKDVTGMFEATKEEELTDVEVTNNAIKRKVYVEESSERVEVTQPGFNFKDKQVHSPGFVEQITENEDDWNNEVIKVMEEIIDDGTTKISSDKETLMNLLNDEGSEKHSH